MEYPYLSAKVTRIKPESQYDGKIYDQTVFVELSDGTIIDIFDSKMLCGPQMIGMIKKVTINVDIGDIERIEPRFGISPSYIINKPSGQGHKFYGQIEDVDVVHSEIIVNIGEGKILAMPARSQIKELHIGEFVSIFSVRTVLEKIQDS